MKHQAPTPWTLTQNSWQYTTIYDAKGGAICRLDLEDWNVTERNQGALEKAQTQIAGRIVDAVNSQDALRAAAIDALAGWQYIRKHHGDLYGVGWDRVERALTAAIDPPQRSHKATGSSPMTDLLELPMRKAASISDCGTFRYRLTRFWGPEHALPFVMLNPSTADADLDDPTIRRCMGFARREKAGGIIVVNLYGLRATEPADLRKVRDPFGPENRTHIHALGKWAFLAGMPVVCAWGTHGWLKSANRDTVHLLKDTGANLVCLGTTKAGEPKHPLYIKGDQPLIPFGGLVGGSSNDG